VANNRNGSGTSLISVAERMGQRLRTVRLGGRALSYVDAGSGPPILLVHGLGASWHVWTPVLEELSSDFRVIAVDLPGAGSSDRLPWAGDLASYSAALVELMRRLGVGPVAIVGHSLGGIVAQRAAAELGPQCSGLVLVSSGGVAMSRLRLHAALGVLSLLRIFVISPVFGLAWRSRHVRKALVEGLARESAALPEDFVRMLTRSYGAPGFWRLLHAARGDVSGGRMPTPDAPTLVMWGRRDPLLPAALGRRLADGLPSARYVDWPEAGHSLMLERPAEFSEAVRSFVRSLDRPGTAHGDRAG
jgi:pimeloyl-ACP methyl ester carboxylesterase